MKKLLVIALLLIGIPVLAAQGDGSISWQPPTEFVNGDLLDANIDLDHYTVHIGDSTGVYNVGTIDIPSGGVSSSVTVSLPDTFQDGDTIQLFLVMTATEIASLGGDTSAFSNEVLKTFLVTITGSVPNPPTAVTATMTFSCTAQNGVTCTITATN